MSECVNKQVGQLLHAYEIGILSEEECIQFEAHILECEYCHSLLRGFESKASILMTSQDAKAVIDEAIAETTGRESVAGRIWRWIWPDVPLVFRPALSYLIILVLLFPVVRGVLGPDDRTAVELKQTIHLSPTRSAIGILRKSVSDRALVTFVVSGYRPGAAYRVVIESEEGETVYSNGQFESFDEREVGSLAIAVSELESGQFRLIVSDPGSPDDSVRHEYRFRIEP